MDERLGSECEAAHQLLTYPVRLRATRFKESGYVSHQPGFELRVISKMHSPRLQGSCFFCSYMTVKRGGKSVICDSNPRQPICLKRVFSISTLIVSNLDFRLDSGRVYTN